MRGRWGTVLQGAHRKEQTDERKREAGIRLDVSNWAGTKKKQDYWWGTAHRWAPTPGRSWSTGVSRGH